jgi:hypothetical protein
MGQNKYKIYAVLLTALIMSGCHSPQHNTIVATPGRTYDSTTMSAPDTTGAKHSVGDSIYYADPNVSILHGTLIQKLFYGPPGFGENPKTDAHYTFFVLVLNKPITVYSDQRGTFTSETENIDSSRIEGIDSIQIRDERTNQALLSSVGKQVAIKGVLNIAVLPSEYTPVILDFQELK